jgi:hypothetical protein
MDFESVLRQRVAYGRVVALRRRRRIHVPAIRTAIIANDNRAPPDIPIPSFGSAKDDTQLLLSVLQDSSPAGPQRPTGANDVQIQHRHRGLKWLCLAPRTPLR